MAQFRRINSVVFNLSTLMDPYARAMERSMKRTFEVVGIPLTNAEITTCMGLPIPNHIQAILDTPSVIINWEKINKCKPSQNKDRTTLYHIYQSLQWETLFTNEATKLIPNVLSSLDRLRDMNLKLGLISNFDDATTRVLLNCQPKLIPYFRAVTPTGHFIPRVIPFPNPIWSNLTTLGCNAVGDCIAIVNTQNGIAQANAATVTSIALTRYSHFIGNKVTDIDELEKKDLTTAELLLDEAEIFMEKAYPSRVIESLEWVANLIETQRSSSNI